MPKTDPPSSLLRHSMDLPSLVRTVPGPNFGFSEKAFTDADPYIPGGSGAQYWVNQNVWSLRIQCIDTETFHQNFFRAVRGINIDLTRMPIGSQATGLHWQVAQGIPIPSQLRHLFDQTNQLHPFRLSRLLWHKAPRPSTAELVMTDIVCWRF